MKRTRLWFVSNPHHFVPVATLTARSMSVHVLKLFDPPPISILEPLCRIPQTSSGGIGRLEVSRSHASIGFGSILLPWPGSVKPPGGVFQGRRALIGRGRPPDRSAVSTRVSPATTTARSYSDDFGIGAEYDFDRRQRGSLIGGLRVGYVERFGNARWSATDPSLTGSPKYGLSGPYVSLTLARSF